MPVKFDAEAAKLGFENAEVKELVPVAYVDCADYVDEAISLAKEELAARGIDGESHPEARKARRAAEKQKGEQQAQAERPANGFVLVLSFIFADVVAIVAALLYSANGRDLASTQVWKAFGYGWLARALVIAWLTYPWGE